MGEGCPLGAEGHLLRGEVRPLRGEGYPMGAERGW